MDVLELLRKRHSVRTYSDRRIEPVLREKLKAEATMVTSHVAGLKFRLFFDNSDPFKGFFKSYGSFKNANNYLTVIGDTSVDDIREKAGYYAEKFVLKCVELGLGTCFVGGTYDVSSVDTPLNAGEKILFIVLLGYEADKIRRKEKFLVNLIHSKKFDPDHFFEPHNEFDYYCEKIPELRKGVEGVALAPSAVNKRPVRVFVQDGKACARVDIKNEMNHYDLGIAKFNYNFITSTHCQWGNGAPLTGGEDD